MPIMLKAEGGGGGRGIFRVTNQEELEDAFSKASAMAQASFGNPRLFVEKYLPNVHHIEIQVIADRWGNVFAFDERDCTVPVSYTHLDGIIIKSRFRGDVSSVMSAFSS